MRMLIVNGRPRLCLFSKRGLEAGEELRYDYAAPDLWWRKEVKQSGYIVFIKASAFYCIFLLYLYLLYT